MDQREAESQAVTGAADRRSFLKKAGVAGAAAWTAPVLLSQAAQAQGTTPVVAPGFVTGATAQSYTGPDGLLDSSRSITLTSNGVQEGDLWIALVAFDPRSDISLPTGSGWTTVGPVNQGSVTGIEQNYAVRAYVHWKILQAGDISGGSFSQTFTTPNGSATWGGLRGVAATYRGTGLVAAITTNQGTGPESSNIVTATFPATAAAPPATNVIVRLGVGRGFGGCNALSDNNDWQTWPGTGRVDASSGNEGDRPMVISEQVDHNGAAATGTWYRQVPVLCSADPNWVTFTAAITNGP